MFWTFVIAAVIQCEFALYIFMRIFRIVGTQRIKPNSKQLVSIIICAKNEAGNLKKNLHAILSQQYHEASGKPMFEVIIVNDASTDDTAHVLQELKQRYDNLNVVTIAPNADRDLKGKKFALSKGVARAENNWLLLTDADCLPASNQWLQLMVTPLAQGKEIVAGYGGYNKTPGLLNAFIRWETMHTFLQYSTYAMAGKPYMAVGRNMACTKKALMQAQESLVWNALQSGDDDLLVRIAGNKTNTAIVADKAAFTYSDAKATMAEWITQKQRHLSTGKYYKNSIKLLLGTYGASHAVMWLCFFLLLSGGSWQDALIIMSARCLFVWATWIVAAVRVQEKNLIYLFPFLDIVWMVYNFAFLPYITWKNKKSWK